MAETARIISVCSGVGMLDEGLCAGLRHFGLRPRVVVYCERDAYAQAVLMARMADASLEPAPICSDLDDIDGRFRGAADIVVAGFPCQPWSHAGAQRGTDDERWLWPALFRVIVDVAPSVCFLENVPGLVSGGGLEYVLSDLAKAGFDAEWCHLSAAAVGAPHKRERVFILAYAAGLRLRELARATFEEGPSDTRPEHARELSWRPEGYCNELADPNGAGLRASGVGQREPLHAEQRDEELADAPRGGLGIVRQPSRSDGQPDGSGGAVGDTQRDGRREREPGRRASGRAALGGAGATVGDTSGAGLPQRAGERRNDGAQCEATERASGALFPPGPGDFDGWRRVLAERPWLAPAIESGFRVPLDGNALVVDTSRGDQLRCSGNSVVAAQAGCAFVELVRRAFGNE